MIEIQKYGHIPTGTTSKSQHTNEQITQGIVPTKQWQIHEQLNSTMLEE